MRVLGIDLGSKRIGVAVSDPTGTLASPYEVVARSGDPARDHRRLAELVAETGAQRVVVGLPYSLDGTIGPAARGVLDEVDRLRLALADVPVETFDERLTTVTAHQRLAEQGRNAKQRRAIVDQAAAAVLLQTWLESPARRAAERESGHDA
jgi:putative Holliday junction resolvase